MNNNLSNNPFNDSILSVGSANLTFIENKKTAHYTKQLLQQWLTDDMDRIFLNSSSEAHDFYNSLFSLISEFETEHANCENLIATTNHKSHVLLNVLYPSYTDLINRYFDAMSKLTQNAMFVNGIPNLPVPSPESLLGFYDRYEKICDTFLIEAKMYNQKIVEIEKMRTLNHKKILDNSLIQKLLKNDKTSLRRIFNVMNVSRLSLIPNS